MRFIKNYKIIGYIYINYKYKLKLKLYNLLIKLILKGIRRLFFYSYIRLLIEDII